MSDTTDIKQQPKSKRGFASMDPSKQRAIAARGGKAAHDKGTAHEFTKEEAQAAGKKGGSTVAKDREHMAEIGRIGGKARGKRLKAKRAEPVETTEPAENQAE